MKDQKPALTLYMTDKLKALLKAAADAKERTDSAYRQAAHHPKGGDGLSQENVDWLMSFERAEKEAYAALGNYVLKAYQELNPSQEDML